MRPLHHEASVNEVNYKYYAPKENSEGKLRGLCTKNMTRRLAKRSLKVAAMR